MRKRSKRGLFPLALLALTAAVLVAASFRLREPQLLERARIVDRSQFWTFMHRYMPLDNMAILDSGSEVKASLVRSHYNPGTTNVMTWHTTEMTALNRLVDATSGNSVYGSVFVTPDGKWAYWKNKKGHLNCARLDGTHWHQWPLTLDSLTPLDGNSHRIVEYAIPSDNAGILTGIRTFDLRPPYSVYYRPIPTTHLLHTNTHDYFGFAENDHLLFGSENHTQGHNSLEIIDADTNAEGVPTRLYTLSLPMNVPLAGVVFSPDGERVAWSFYRNHVPPFLNWLHRLVPGVKVKPHRTYELWVSRLDGSGRHEIGTLMLDPDKYLTDSPSILQWQFDGKRLRFTYQDALYTVPAD
jgi:hypothetical protein